MASSKGGCANCGTLSTRHCGRCAEGLGPDLSLSPTYYCGQACQQANFETHKSICRVANARKRLRRGAELVQDVYYAFRETAFDIEPKKIKVIDGKIHFELAWSKEIDLSANHYPFFPFPKDAIKKEDDKKALLVWNTCDDAVAYMHELLRKVFEGTVNVNAECSPLEWYVVVKDERKTIFRRYPSGELENVRFQHLVLNVGLEENDEHYFIDITGAQYRQYSPLITQQRYKDGWLMGGKEKHEFGALNERLKNAIKYQNDPLFAEHDMRGMIMHHEVADILNNAVKDWERKAGKTVAKMLAQKKAAFQIDKAALMREVTRDMRRWLELRREKGINWDVKEVKVEDVPKFEDKKKAFTYGDDVPQDVKTFMEEEARKGTTILDMKNFHL